MSAAGCQTGMPVLCHAHNEHTTGTWFAPGRANSEAPVAMELCVLTSGTSRQAEQRHSARTAVGPAGVQRYPQGLSYTDPTESSLAFRSVSAKHAEGDRRMLWIWRSAAKHAHQCKGERRSVRGPSLVALQKELPMAPNWMSSCKLVDCRCSGCNTM